MSNKWEIVKLREVVRLDLDRIPIDPSKSYPMVGVLSFGRGLFDREPIENGNTSYKYFYRLKANHIVMSQLFGWEGALALSSEEFAGKFMSPQFPTFLCDETKLHREFLGWIMRRPAFWEDLGSRASGMGDRRRTLNPEALFACDTPLPPMAEQRQIVAKIDQLAAKISEARGLRHQAVEEASALLNAKLCHIGTCFQVKGKLGDVLAAPPRNGWSARCDNAEDGIPVLALSAVTGYRYRPREFKRSSLSAATKGHFWLKPGDLLITRSNTPELVGHAAIYDGNPSPCIYPDLMMRLELRDNAVDQRFVWYWLQAPPVREFIRQSAKGTSPTMKKIAQGTVMAIPFPSSLPVSEQRRIVAELDAMQAEVDALKRSQAETTAELDALLPSILDKAFKGEL
jgi:type I restriction enzyme S subunit